MTVVETFQIITSMGLFVRAFVRAALVYFNESKAPRQEQLKGKGIFENNDLPTQLPSITEIKRVLPKHCFQPDMARSLLYMLKDAVQIAICFGVFYLLHTAVPNPIVYWVSMFFYWAIQGTFFTAVFVVGHDCGHESFSNNRVVNDVIGNIFHSFLLCPYYMWKLSHKNHHKNNNNYQKDEVYYPVIKTDPSSKNKVIPGFGFGVGWFGYLLRGYSPRNVPHFNPFHEMFKGHYIDTCISLASLGGMLYLLHHFYLIFGGLALFNYYFIPTMIFASYMVVITFLHHHEMNIPWYHTSKWDFVRGQLSTIDRNYGIVHDIIHCIGTHQMHHMFSKIPHYHLEEATTHFRKAFPNLVRSCDEPIVPSFIRMYIKYEKQSRIDEGTQVHYYT